MVWTRRCLLVLAILLTSCAQKDVEVFRRKAALTGSPGSGSLGAVEQRLTQAMREEHAHPLVALGDCLAALQSAARELERQPSNAGKKRPRIRKRRPTVHCSQNFILHISRQVDESLSL